MVLLQISICILYIDEFNNITLRIINGLGSFSMKSVHIYRIFILHEYEASHYSKLASWFPISRYSVLNQIINIRWDELTL